MTISAEASWTPIALRRLVTIRSSNVDKIVDEGEKVVLLCNYVDVYYNSQIHSGIEFSEGSAKLHEIARFELNADDVIITKDSETPDDIAIPALVDASAEGVVCGYHLAILRPRRSQITGPFLFWALRAKMAREAFALAAQGVTRFGLTLNGIGSVKIAVPDLSTQKAIAAFLYRETARIDQLIAKKENQIQLLDAHAVAAASDLVEEALNLHNPPVAALRHCVLSMCDGPFGSSLKSEHYSDSGVRVIRLQNIGPGRFIDINAAFIRESHYELLGDHDVEAGDLLVASLGDAKNPVGRACLAPSGLGPAMVKADCFRVRLNEDVLLHSFLECYLNSPRGIELIGREAKGVTRDRINLSILAAIKVPLLPLEIQLRITSSAQAVRETMHSLSAKILHSIDVLREQRGALITAAVGDQLNIDGLPAGVPTQHTQDQERLHGT